MVDWIHVAGYPATFNLADVAIRAGAVAVVAVVLGGGAHPRRWLRLDRGPAGSARDG